MKYIIIGLFVFAAYLFFAKKRTGKDNVVDKKEDEKVPQGLQIFDEKGNVVIDITNRLVKVVGEVTMNGKNGSVYVKELEGQEVWVAYKRKILNNRLNGIEPFELDSLFPIVTVKDGLIKWEYKNPYYVGCNISLNYWGNPLAAYTPGIFNFDRIMQDIEITLIYGVH